MNPRATVGVASAATFLVLVMFTVPLATLPATSAALHSGPEGQAWILSSASIGLAVALLSSGAVADDLGRRRVLVGGAVLLALASVACALAPGTAVLVGGRIAEGAGGAALLAAGLGLIGHTHRSGTPEARKATALWGASVGAGIAVGPLLATGLERAVGWTGPYWLVAAGALVLAVVARRLLEESRAEEHRPLDLPGVGVLAAGLALLLAGLVEARGGLVRPVTWGPLAGGVVLLAAFVAVERRRRHPMIDLALLRSPRFAAVTLAAFGSGTGVIALTSFLPSVVERGLGRTAVVGALVLLPWSATSVVTSLLARRLPSSWSGRAQFVVGMLVVAAGLLLLYGAGPDSSPWRLVPGLFVAGIATGVINAALGREAVASVPPGRTAMGSGANNTARYVGSAIGVTVVAVVATRPGLAPGPAGLMDGFDTALLVTAAFTVLGAIAVALTRTRAVP